jgi:hypothetical protein
VTYIPVPAGQDIDYAGLLTIEPPSADWHGKSYTVVVRQVTNAYGAVPKEPKGQVASVKGQGDTIRSGHSATFSNTGGATTAGMTTGGTTTGSTGKQKGGRGGNPYRYRQWRRVIGAFQLTVPVKAKTQLLAVEERRLALLRWVAEAIPAGTRWHPVFQRYLDVIAGRVRAFGGDPKRILPSPSGTVEPYRPPSGGHHGEHPGKPGAHPGHIDQVGKVGGLLFDHFGDFEGFVLHTEHGRHRYRSHEKDIERLVDEAWRRRLRLSVRSERHDPDRVISIMILTPPVSFARDDERH